MSVCLAASAHRCNCVCVSLLRVLFAVQTPFCFFFNVCVCCKVAESIFFSSLNRIQCHGERLEDEQHVRGWKRRRRRRCSCCSTSVYLLPERIFQLFFFFIETALLYLHPIRNKEACFCLFFPPLPLILIKIYSNKLFSSPFLLASLCNQTNYPYLLILKRFI